MQLFQKGLLESITEKIMYCLVLFIIVFHEQYVTLLLIDHAKLVILYVVYHYVRETLSLILQNVWSNFSLMPNFYRFYQNWPWKRSGKRSNFTFFFFFYINQVSLLSCKWIPQLPISYYFDSQLQYRRRCILTLDYHVIFSLEWPSLVFTGNLEL